SLACAQPYFVSTIRSAIRNPQSAIGSPFDRARGEAAEDEALEDEREGDEWHGHDDGGRHHVAPGYLKATACGGAELEYRHRHRALVGGLRERDGVRNSFHAPMKARRPVVTSP